MIHLFEIFCKTCRRGFIDIWHKQTSQLNNLNRFSVSMILLFQNVRLQMPVQSIGKDNNFREHCFSVFTDEFCKKVFASWSYFNQIVGFIKNSLFGRWSIRAISAERTETKCKLFFIQRISLCTVALINILLGAYCSGNCN